MRLRIKGFGRGGIVPVLAVFLVLLVSSAALGAGANLRCDGTSGSGFVYLDTVGGTKVPEGRVLQYISGSKLPPDPNNGCLSGSNVSLYLGEVGDGTGDPGPNDGPPGTFYVSDTTASGTPIYVRVWNTTSLPTGGNPSNRYGYSQVFTAASSISPPIGYSVPNFVTNYIADVPAKPTITSITGLGYDGATINWSLSSNYEITREVFSWGTDTNASNGNSFVVSGTSYTFDRMALNPGTKYYVKVKAINYFGDSAWSDVDSFTTVGGVSGGTANDLRIQLSGGTVTLTWEGVAPTYEVWGAELDGSFSKLEETTLKSWSNPTYTTVSSTTERYFQIRVSNGQSAPEVVGWYTFNLKKLATGKKTGINSISMPVDTTVSGNSPNIFTASDVDTALGSYFEFIGGWDKAAQTEFAYLNGGTGVNFPIRKGEGYQISVSSDTTWTVVGEK